MEDQLTEELAQVALDAIDEFGAHVGFVPAEESTYDPSQSKTIRKPSVAVPAKALVEDYSLNNSFVTGLIKSGDKKFTMAGKALANVKVEAGSKVLFGTSRYTVLNVKAYYLGATPILFEIQGRS